MEQDYTTYTCDCDDGYVDVEATTATEGSKHTECTVCGEIIKTEVIAKLPVPSVGLEFELNEDGQSYFLKGIGTCADIDIVITKTYNGLPVTSIGYDAFYDCTSLTIYCESESKPIGWDSSWNPDDRPVVWDYKNK